MHTSKAAGRIGEERVNAAGEAMRVVAYRNNRDIDVLFPDTGETRRNVAYCNFARGRVAREPAYRTVPGKGRLENAAVNAQGLRMVVCEYRNADSIDVRFDDGTVVRNARYSGFLNGSVRHPGYPAPSPGRNCVGETAVNRQGIRMEIIAYRSSRDVDVLFRDWNGTVLRGADYRLFRNGSLSAPFAKTEYGVGYIGDGPYTGRAHGKAYRTWRSLLARCYDPGDRSYHRCGKRGVAVCAEWHCFQDFCAWYEAHYYDPSQELVPDIDLKGGMSYGPDTCVMVPLKLKRLLRPRMMTGKRRGLPVGAFGRGNRFYSSICEGGSVRHLGIFDTAGEAHAAYLAAKADALDRCAEELDGRLSDEARATFAEYRNRLRASTAGG